MLDYQRVDTVSKKNQTSNTLVKLVHDLDVHHGNTPECLRRRIRNLSSVERDDKGAVCSSKSHYNPMSFSPSSSSCRH